MNKPSIVVRGARQNNLKHVNLDLPLNELIVVTGVSGSGKSSLAFDTIYAEGQRRYVETFSPYARQFLDRMDKPAAERIEGIPPAIAIDQTNPVRTSRSTVGTMTELNDHLKLLYARAAALHCRGCGALVRRDTPDSASRSLLDKAEARDAPVAITFSIEVPHNFAAEEAERLLASQGYTRIFKRNGNALEVVQDRMRLAERNASRLRDALEQAFVRGKNRLAVHMLNADGEARRTWRYSTDLHCADCDIQYREPQPNFFSFNSPMGACETCRGFGRVIGVDYGLVIPDESKTLAGGAIKPWQTESNRECQRDLLRFARARGVPVEVPWRELTDEQRAWVIEGEGDWEKQVWYGVRRFFDWLETKAYKMHIRVLLSKYRAYTECTACGGARLQPESLLWRLGDRPAYNIHELMVLPIERCRAFIRDLKLPAPLDEATELLLREIRCRLDYVVEVGLGYLTLDRQSRTLSGGEVQRINLTTALGTSLVNTLFVLDEPSIGLHPRDIGRVINVLHRLRDAGNTLLVVEHDPEVMLAADRIIDVGPGPGERGGEIVFNGVPQALTDSRSLTADYLCGRKSVVSTRAARGPADHFVELLGASENNLKNVDARIPLNRLVCITGVSGSGKSTLIQDVLYPAVRKALGTPSEQPGGHRELRGMEYIEDVVLVDQSPIGRTTRSNPASYVGALDAIRKLFAAEPRAKERGYTAATFSSNAGNGRCPTCGGNGYEHVEMQFLSDVYLRCPDCDGKRFRAEVLEVKVTGADGVPRSVADVLELTAAEAAQCFAAHPEVRRALKPLDAVGLGYVRLGQPVPTLSGGEAQRLKLAGHLAEFGARAKKGKGTLFLLDEPTTGLHFDDVAVLLHALERLLEQGHSLIVIEHNLDVVRNADWIIDLGPEGGDAGGEIVACGTPEQIKAHHSSHTGAALRAYTLCVDGARAAHGSVERENAICVHHAREHNLKNVDVVIPRDQFTVITGVSGSGKSTIAFDILFAEGQRRYLESLNAYARQFVQPAARPDVDAIYGIPPTVAIEQRTSRGGRKSTVATMTEIYHFLRLLFVKLGTQYCPGCDVPIEAQSLDAMVARLLRQRRGRTVRLYAPLVAARKGYYTDLAQWAAAKGYPHLRVDGAMLPTNTWPRLDRFKEHNIELPVGELRVAPETEQELRTLLQRALDYGKGVALVAALTNKGEAREESFSLHRNCSSCGRGFPELDPRLFSYNSKHGWCPQCYGTGLALQDFDESQTGEEIWWNEWFEGQAQACPGCDGARLRPEALAVYFDETNIAALTELPISAAARYFAMLRLKGRDGDIARDILAELRPRLAFLQQVGLGYLALNRAAPTLSGGEAQRIRLAAQLGSNLRGVCYILDEPTIGLHPRDNRLLLDTLRALQRKGNTVVVVEHDEDTIRCADHVIDLGPGAGRRGGEIVAKGTVHELLGNPASVTGRCLAQPMQHPLRGERRIVDKRAPHLEVIGATLHNLKKARVRIPLQRLVCVTGVSGSGKSTLVRDVVHDNVRALLTPPRRRKRGAPKAQGCGEVRGAEHVTRVLEVDQTPIGKTPRSCPATYVGFWDAIRKLYAQTAEARLRGYGPGRFSFNTSGGRCETCLGQGVQRIEMNFLPDVDVPCEACDGARFNAETLGVIYKDKSIADVLAMNVDEAVEFFAAHPSVHHALCLLQDVGLGYLTLGQQSPTLSGGEAQRIKLVTELAKAKPPNARRTASEHALYVLDEPTIGLHMADVSKLIIALHRLVDAGHSVLLIEHDLDVIAEADWVIDLGPEGGERGGRIVAQGSPEDVARIAKSHTGEALRNVARRNDDLRAHR